jgi:hypothetical protein
MAIRKKPHGLKLTPEDVRTIRKRFFLDLDTIAFIALDYPVTERTIKDAIHGKGGYAKITDDIGPKTKKERVAFREVWANPKTKTEKARRQYKKWELDYLKKGGSLAGTPLHLRDSPANIDWKDEERKERVAQNRHWKGWD